MSGQLVRELVLEVDDSQITRWGLLKTGIETARIALPWTPGQACDLEARLPRGLAAGPACSPDAQRLTCGGQRSPR